jgi:hypothetical protein
MDMGEYQFRRTLRAILWCTGVSAILLVLLHLSLPYAVNRNGVRKRILAYVSKQLPGEVQVQSLIPSLLPRLGLSIDQGRYTDPDLIEARIKSGFVSVRWIPLLFGRLELDRMNVDEPELTLYWPEADAEHQHPEARHPTDAIKTSITHAASVLSAAIGRARFHIRNAQLSVRYQRQPFLDMTFSLRTRRLASRHTGYRLEVPDLRLFDDPHTLRAEVIQVQGTVRWTPDRFNLTVSRFQSDMPKLFLNGSLTLPIPYASQTPITIDVDDGTIDVTSLRTTLHQTIRSVPVLKTVFDIVRGGHISSLRASFSAPTWDAVADVDNLNVEGIVSDGRIMIPEELFLLNDVRGNVRWSGGRLSAANASARLADSAARGGTLVLGLLDGTKAFSLDTRLSANLSELPPILKKLVRDPSELALLEKLPALSGRADGRLILGDRLDQIRATIQTEASVTLLDADITITGSIEDVPSPLGRININGKGALGPESVNWLGRIGGVSEKWMPQDALTVSNASLARTPDGTMVIRSDIRLATEVDLSAELQLRPQTFHLNKLHVRDKTSDAILSAHRNGMDSPWRVVFKGLLDVQTVNKLFPQDRIHAGVIDGDLQAEIDTVEPERSRVEGSVEARRLACQLPIAGPVLIPSMQLDLHNDAFAISSATVEWQNHSLAVSGSGTLSPRNATVDLHATADTLDITPLIHAAASRPAEPADLPDNERRPFALQGRIQVDIGDMAYGSYRFVPLHAGVELERDQVIVDITSANVCGVEVPGQIRWLNGVLALTFHPFAEDSDLQYTGSCLNNSKKTEHYQGTVDVDGKIVTKGSDADRLMANLKGNVTVKIRDGRVSNIGKAGFLTNILSYMSVNELIEGDLPDLSKEDFKYKSIESKLKLKKGLLHIEEGILKSNALNLVTEGVYDVSSDNLKLNVLVSPLTTVDWVVAHVPIVNRILQGTLVAVPVRVTGPLSDPTVVPLSPSAVGSRVGGILKRILQTPYYIIEPILPKQKDDAKQTGE